MLPLIAIGYLANTQLCRQHIDSLTIFEPLINDYEYLS